MTKQFLKESEAQVDALKKILKDKEVEILKAKRHLHRAKEEVMREYRDSDAFLKELWAPLLMVLTTASVRSKPPSLT